MRGKLLFLVLLACQLSLLLGTIGRDTWWEGP